MDSKGLSLKQKFTDGQTDMRCDKHGIIRFITVNYSLLEFLHSMLPRIVTRLLYKYFQFIGSYFICDFSSKRSISNNNQHEAPTAETGTKLARPRH